MRIYNVTLEFPNGILSNKPDATEQAFNTFAKLVTGKKPKDPAPDISIKGSKISDKELATAFEEYKRKEAEQKTYKNEEGLYGVPVQWLKSAMTEVAGKKIKEQFGNAKIKWREDFQHIYGEPEVSPLSPQKMTPRLDRGVLKNGGKKSQVPIIRAEYPRKSQVQFNITVSDEITDSIFKEVLNEAGLRGLGDWRTSGFGAYKVLTVTEQS